MKFAPEIHHRRSIRLRGYDFSRDGAYFITICTQNRECLFGEIVSGEMRLNDFDMVINDTWICMKNQYDYLDLGEYVIMRNHFHGLFIINKCSRGSSRTAPSDKSIPLGRLLGVFKTVSTKRINEMRQPPGVPVWQRNYYEHIVRDDDELNHIREYIICNPTKWDHDEDNPANFG
jgi:putative transposase